MYTPFGKHLLELEEDSASLDKAPSQVESLTAFDAVLPSTVAVDTHDCDSLEATAIVTLDGETHDMRWRRTTVLLDVLLNRGLDAPFSCREGHCGACTVLKKSGEVSMAANKVLSQSDLAGGLILGCQAKPTSAQLELTYDE